jgi:titin
MKKNKNNSCTDFDRQIYFILSERPEIEYEKKFAKPQALKASTIFNIPVKVAGIPTPKVTWTLNGKPVEQSKKLNIDVRAENFVLTVKNLAKQDAGVYTVSAENLVGKKHAEFELTVMDKPSPPRDLQVTEVQRDAVTVTWQPPEDDGGSPLTQYILERRDAKRTNWTSAGKSKPTELKLLIPKLIEGNEYFIRVIAENEIGESEPCELKDPVKPKSPFGE